MNDIPYLFIVKTESGFACGQFGGTLGGLGTGYLMFNEDFKEGTIDGILINVCQHEDLNTALIMLKNKIMIKNKLRQEE